MPAVCLGERGRHAMLINKNTKVPFELSAIKICVHLKHFKGTKLFRCIVGFSTNKATQGELGELTVGHKT